MNALRAWINPLMDLDNLPDPEVLTTEILENLSAGMAYFKEILNVLPRKAL
ncbi:MAG: hypothetical protein HQM11_02650 [SAR324 cluster bacterium]|nr:hypothetical protein [SAR324 cluster bacterium]